LQTGDIAAQILRRLDVARVTLFRLVKPAQLRSDCLPIEILDRGLDPAA